MAGHLDFYFFYGSIHSYLSVMRIGALASAAGVEVRVPFACRRRRARGRILHPARMQ
jgi:2-hydroxychromene-2-carboxylate isomerase